MLFSSLKNRVLREGIYFRRMLEFLNESQFYSKDELECYQNENLQKLISHAYENVPYYHDIFNEKKLKPTDIKNKEDLWKIPLLKKDDVKKNFHALKAKNKPKLLMNLGHTSGTTGTPAHFYRDLRSINFENAIVWRQWLWADFQKGSKLAICRGNQIIEEDRDKPPFWVENKLNNQLYLSSFHMTEENLIHYIKKMEQYRPEALQAYPSTAYTIAKTLKKMNKKLHLKAIFTSSEPIYSYQRETIEEVFDCEIWDFYGMAERVISASECQMHKGLHLNEEYGITEFIHNDVEGGSEGIMVGTALHNFGMPLIRYVTNDYGIIDQNGCKCGREHTLIKPIETKQEDMIITKDGRWISPSIITHAFKPLNHLLKSQIIQHDFDDYEILLVPEEKFHQEEIDILLIGLRERFGSDSNINIKIVEDIPRTKNGKYRWVISNVSGGIISK
ncbi:phenylacetate--CoA ligase family protein [Bacillus mobilis]|uniref:phenylacetate--CoA ligase family protein n=1 Tax=Bacillus mobilis TaxID=2026190 RepID=UPI0035D92B95